ncbi:hypothetical protein MB84_28495 (plasmid) [Pandoraea oxalativorans]|uniref:Uncharacterized protein n=1 Tax=Pandoraea oxalativorans TaxID=573737 RepID=A0A0G3IFR5_9BURK|nr:hypothetical protein MB84_28495 [Pandoraea oxalativorans]
MTTMASVLTFSYKGFRVLCTATPATHGGFRGSAKILWPAPGLFQARQIAHARDTFRQKEQLALASAASLAREWIDLHRKARW